MSKTTLLDTAAGYLQAGEYLVNICVKNRAYMRKYIRPCIDNLAFSCELYLKYFYEEENGVPAPETPNVLDLFEKLSKKLKAEVEEEYQDTDSLLSISDCILVHNHSFDEYHNSYMCERVSAEPLSLYGLAVALENTWKKRTAGEENDAH